MAKGDFCVAHPDNPSTGRCVTCHKPFCAECAVESPQGVFCSRRCLGNYAEFKQRSAGIPELRRPWIFRAAVLLVILAVAGYGLYAYFVQKDPALRNAVEGAKRSVEKAGR